MLLVWQITTLEQKVNQMNTISQLIAVIMTLFVIGTAAQAETFDLSSHGNWQVKLYMGDNSNSCDLVTKVDNVQLNLEYWTDNSVSLVLHLFNNELEPVPSDITLRFRIDRKSPFKMSNARNYGNYILFSHDASSTVWGNLIKELSSGQRLYFINSDGKAFDPSFSLRGSTRAIADWKQCIKRLGQA